MPATAGIGPSILEEPASELFSSRYQAVYSGSHHDRAYCRDGRVTPVPQRAGGIDPCYPHAGRNPRRDLPPSSGSPPRHDRSDGWHYAHGELCNHTTRGHPARGHRRDTIRNRASPATVEHPVHDRSKCAQRRAGRPSVLGGIGPHSASHGRLGQQRRVHRRRHSLLADYQRPRHRARSRSQQQHLHADPGHQLEGCLPAVRAPHAAGRPGCRGLEPGPAVRLPSAGPGQSLSTSYSAPTISSTSRRYTPSA